MNTSFYQSEEEMAVTIKDFFVDRKGFPNEQAFYHFIQSQSDLFKKIPFRIICMNVDLRKANVQSIAYGDDVLKKLILSLEEYAVFHIQGEKFNILVEEDRLAAVRSILEKPSDDYDIYFGVVEKRFVAETEAEVKEYIREGIELMFECKSNGKNKAQEIVGNKGATPKELKETALKKYRSTMWCSTIKVTITEPIYKEVMLYVYPTEFKQPLQSIPSIVVLSDNLNYRVFYSADVHFGMEGLLFTVNSRFDREGHLNTSIFNTGSGKCTFHVETVEGVCVPANFGKRITPFREIYPVKKNLQGYCDYVNLENGKVTMNTEGIVTTASGSKYGVLMDNVCIDLIPIHEENVNG